MNSLYAYINVDTFERTLTVAMSTFKKCVFLRWAETIQNGEHWYGKKSLAILLGQFRTFSNFTDTCMFIHTSHVRNQC